MTVGSACHMHTKFLLLLFAALLLVGCQTTSRPGGIQAARITMMENIKSESPGNYFIGRRYFKKDYKFWGYIRRPGEPWTSAKLVMMNEQQKYAPDREAGTLGSDHNYEYKLLGRFSGDTVYEPASNGFYPEFVLSGYELRSSDPAPIFRTKAATDPERRVLGQPY